MALFKDPVLVSFVDADNNTLLDCWDNAFLPRVGENVRIAKRPYLVEKVGYDIPAEKIERVWVVLRPV